MGMAVAYNPCGWCPYKESGERCGMCELAFLRKAWISVDERLPDNGNAVLVNRYNKRLKFSVANIDNYQGYGKWWDKDYDETVWKITHWMPLPEDPKGGE